jgi:hypothetical protein
LKRAALMMNSTVSIRIVCMASASGAILRSVEPSVNYYDGPPVFLMLDSVGMDLMTLSYTLKYCAGMTGRGRSGFRSK